MTYELVSLILPVYNQGDHIQQIVEEYIQALNRISTPYELILVVNNSRDNSITVCQELAGKYSFVRVLESKEGGWGLAVRLGLKATQGDLICYTNSARTSPQDLQLLLLYAIANPGVIIKANRKIRENWRRRLGSLLYNLEVRALFDVPYWDINGTPKVFPRQCDQLLRLSSNDDLIDAEFNAICAHEDYHLLEVPILSTRRHGGKSTTRLKSAFRMYIGAYRLWQQMGGKPRRNGTPLA